MSKIKLIKRIFSSLFSQKGLSILIILATIAALTLILSSRYFMFESFIENGISKKDIYASKTIRISDTEATEKRKREIEKRVDPILKPAQDVHIRKNLFSLISSISSIKTSTLDYKEKKQRLDTLLNIEAEDYLDKKTINYILSSTNASFSKLSRESMKTMDKILERGISEDDMTYDIDNIINANISNTFNKNQKYVIGFMIKQVLAPNMIVDELATDITRKNAINSVKPIVVTFKKGDKIVSSQEVVTKLQKNALEEEGYDLSTINTQGIMGIFCFISIVFTVFSFFLLNYEPKYFTPSYLLLIAMLSIVTSLTAVFIPATVSKYLIPYTSLAILLTVFTTTRVALIASGLILTIIAVTMQYKIEEVAVFLIGISSAVFTTSTINYSRRMDLVKTGINISLVQVLTILSVYLFQNNLYDISTNLLSVNLLCGFTSGLISGVIALGVLPLIESTLKIITPYGLAELADHNQPLLRRLQFEAPGTYHHSLMVSNLAEAAAEAIGADPVLVRVGAFYHDVGKLKRPLFFVENQSYFGIENPHESLNPRLSKMVITAHPKDGVELVKEYKLPTVVQQFIMQHHGNGLAAYFYKQAITEEGAENVTEEQFRYNGPKPSSKEAAILMMADAVESAVRALKTPTQEEIEALISKLVKERLDDGQFEDSPLTQRDITTIKTTFNRILRGMQHHRIKYHENMIEELESKAAKKIQMMNTTKNIEKEFLDQFNKDQK